METLRSNIIFTTTFVGSMYLGIWEVKEGNTDPLLSFFGEYSSNSISIIKGIRGVMRFDNRLILPKEQQPLYL